MNKPKKPDLPPKAGDLTPDGRKRLLDTLSSAEMLVAWYMVNGITKEKELSESIGTSIKTIGTQKTQIYKKLGLSEYDKKQKVRFLEYFYRETILLKAPDKYSAEHYIPPPKLAEIEQKQSISDQPLKNTPSQGPILEKRHYIGDTSPKAVDTPYNRPGGLTDNSRRISGLIIIIIAVLAIFMAIATRQNPSSSSRSGVTPIPTPSEFTDGVINLDRPGSYSIDMYFSQAGYEDNWLSFQIKFLVEVEFRHIIAIDYNRKVSVIDDLGNRYYVYSNDSFGIDTSTGGEYLHTVKLHRQLAKEVEYIFIDIDEMVVQQYVPSLHSDVFYIVPPDVRIKINSD